jgi:hypothetical protein
MRQTSSVRLIQLELRLSVVASFWAGKIESSASCRIGERSGFHGVSSVPEMRLKAGRLEGVLITRSSQEDNVESGVGSFGQHVGRSEVH